MEQMSVLIFSASFGAGHVRAAEAVIEALREKEPNVKLRIWILEHFSIRPSTLLLRTPTLSSLSIRRNYGGNFTTARQKFPRIPYSNAF